MDKTEARRQWVKAVGGYSFVGLRTGVVSKRVEQWCMEGFPPKKAIQLRALATEKRFPLDEDLINFDPLLEAAKTTPKESDCAAA